MKMKLEIGSGTAEETERLKVKKKNWTKKRIKRMARWRRRKDYLRVQYYTRRYDKRFMVEDPAVKEIESELNTTWKLFAFCLSYFTVRTDKHQPDTIRPINDMLCTRNVTDKELVYFQCYVMHRNKMRVDWFCVGYKNGYMLPMCTVIENYITVTMSTVYKIHTGDRFQIMRDYYPDGNSWKVLHWHGSKLIMSFIENRSEYGDPDVMIYDNRYWDKHEPLVKHLLDKMKWFNDGVVYDQGMEKEANI